MDRPLIDPARADTAGPLIAVQRAQPAPRRTAPHRHARGQLLGAWRGLLTIGTGHSHFVMPPSHCLWLPPHQRHSLVSHGPFDGWSVYVDAAACADLPTAPFMMRCSGLLREAVARAQSWTDATPLQRQGHLAAVILDEIGSLPRESLGLPMPRDRRLAKIAQAVLDDLADNRRLEDWAEQAGVSARTVTRRFPLETGFSFTQWRQRARLMRSLELLAAKQSVTSVAFELGYDTVSAFIALFKRHFGTTPRRYLEGAAAGEETGTVGPSSQMELGRAS